MSSTVFDNKDKQKNNMVTQINLETYQAVNFEPKRMIAKVVDYLNKEGLKSTNGQSYNYHKVWQVLSGRWEDVNVSLGYEKVWADEKKKFDEAQALKKQRTELCKN